MHPDLLRATSDHGLVMRSEVLAYGGDDRHLRQATRAGVLVRVRPGTYAWRDRWEGLDPVRQHVLLARGVLRKSQADSVLSHVTAVTVHGGPTWGLRLDEVHLTRPDRRGGRREAGVVHHRGALREADLTVVAGLPVTSAARTALDLTTLVDLEHALPVMDDFLHRGLTTTAAMAECRRDMDSWPGTLSSDLALRLADGRRESVGESRTAYQLYLGGLPRPVPQHEVRDGTGLLVARVDFAWPALGVFLEFDGKVKYLEHRRPGESVVDAVLREKRREEQVCRLTGWRCVRLVWSDLRDPAAVASYVGSVLAGGPVHR